MTPPGPDRLVPVPKLAETTDTVLVEQWLVAVGDVVAAGQALATVETDKAVVEVPSPAAGTVAELLVVEGTEASTGDPLCRLEE